MENNKEKFKIEFRRRVEAWVLDLVRFLDVLPKDTITQRLIDQLFRSGGSIGANYIEAQAASSRKDFTNFLHHALKSANESEFWLTLLKNSGRGDSADIEKLVSELREIANILGSSLLTLQGRR